MEIEFKPTSADYKKGFNNAINLIKDWCKDNPTGTAKSLYQLIENATLLSNAMENNNEKPKCSQCKMPLSDEDIRYQKQYSLNQGVTKYFLCTQCWIDL